MSAAAPLIELARIERVFQLGDSEVHALRQLDLAIGAGEYVAVMGPSGSGKSTLLNLLGLLDRPNAGTYRLEGRDVTTLSAEEQARVRSERIGFVFQSFHLVPRLTAAENIALPMTLAGIGPAEREARVAQALQDFGLANRADHRPVFTHGSVSEKLFRALRKRMDKYRRVAQRRCHILENIKNAGTLGTANRDERNPRL